MGRSAFIVGGTGQIGRAVALRLVEKGWRVAVAGRDPAHVPPELERAGVSFVKADRSQPGVLEAALEPGSDVLIDVIPFTADDARQLVALPGRVGSIVAVSTAAVYADAEGRSLDTQQEAFPDLPVPMSERQPTVEPGDATYATRKVAMERVLLESGLPTSIVRPCAVHGPGPQAPRELYFVQRLLDGRSFVPLAYRGLSRFHTTSIGNLAELVWLAAERPGRRVVNCGDPTALTVLDIGRAVAAALDRDCTEVLLPGAPEGTVGDTPWSGPRPFVLDMQEAELELRYRAVVGYERAVEETCTWLVDVLRGRDWQTVFPDAVEHFHFDYDAEDELVRSLVSTA